MVPVAPAAESVEKDIFDLYADSLTPGDSLTDSIAMTQVIVDLDHPLGTEATADLTKKIDFNTRCRDFVYAAMISDPGRMRFRGWELPVPPPIPEDDNTFLGYLRRLDIPKVNVSEATIEDLQPASRCNWLHTVNFALQLSQAYISHNWYQGGNDYLAFFGNFLWDVQLNQVYHPKLLFQSTLSYKLAITSTSQDQYHKYSVSQELFQYNAKFGYKAAKKWYYSLQTQFTTQFLNNYEQNTMNRVAAFLSPGTLTVGAGMTYSHKRADKRLTFSSTISPVAYNLKTCIDDMVDHAQFNMQPGQKALSEYGSSAEVNFYWAFRENISYKTRLFLFTDYKNFIGDWENTLNFQFSKYFSTQLYFYFRYDTGADPHLAPKWKKWMLKEILSVGLSYTFSTNPGK